MTTRLQIAMYALGEQYMRAKRRDGQPTQHHARALLAELGVNGAERVSRPAVRMIETDEQLDALPETSVIRDREERVLELWGDRWLLTGETGYNGEIDLPARVLYTPEDES